MAAGRESVETVQHHLSVWSSGLPSGFRDRFGERLKFLDAALSQASDGTLGALRETELRYVAWNGAAHEISLLALECASLCRLSHPADFLALCGVLKIALHGDLPLEARDLERLLELLTGTDPLDPRVMPVDEAVGQIERWLTANPLPDDWRPLLERLHHSLARSAAKKTKSLETLLGRIERLGDESVTPRLKADNGWADRAREEIGSLPEEVQAKWERLLREAARVVPEPPATEWDISHQEIESNSLDREAYEAEHARRFFERTAASTWVQTMQAAIEAVGRERFETARLRWMQKVPDSRPGGLSQFSMNREVLRGLVWTSERSADPDLARALRVAAVSLFAKNSPLGRSVVRVLGTMPAPNTLPELSLLVQQVKAEIQIRLVEQARLVVAGRSGVPTDSLEDMPLPTSGFIRFGRRVERLSGSTAELAISAAGGVELRWYKSTGELQKSVPTKVRRDHEVELHSLKAAVKEVASTLTAARERLESAPFEQRTWSVADWRERYVDHPVVGTLGRRVLWQFDQAGAAAVGGFVGCSLVHRDGTLVIVNDATRVAVWHPLGAPVDEVLEWREWLAAHEIRQPFKQAYREIYLLTDAERTTETYSNRFAAHILKQSQFRALAKARGWKAPYLGGWDGGDREECSLELPRWKLRAELWVAAAGDAIVEEYGGGGVVYVSTDQVRFLPAGGGDPLRLADVPPLAFSEVMRDVDLFVGVASVGNDPAWRDGGRTWDGDYWRRYSFGELTETALTRRAALERIIPRLWIADRCTFSDRFLIVEGDLRTYRIHLGSGNILMEPNGQYLCIVPARTADPLATRFLPFEGDDRLSLILSKALLLADDSSITDPTILSQISAG